MFKKWTIGALVVALALSVATGVLAQGSTANVEVRVWQSTRDAESLFISARRGAGWDTLGTIPLDMSALNARETYRYGDTTVAVPLPEPMLPNSTPYRNRPTPSQSATTQRTGTTSDRQVSRSSGSLGTWVTAPSRPLSKRGTVSRATAPHSGSRAFGES